MIRNTPKKNKTLIGILIAVCAISILIYLIFFLNNLLLFFVLVIGSATVVSTSTIYTVIHHAGSTDERIREKKFLSKAKALEKRKKLVKKGQTSDIIEKYMKSMPSIQNYAESEKSYEEMPIIEEIIFTELSPEERIKINRLRLPDIDKKRFIKEILYFNKEERMNLIDSMFENQDKIDEEIIYIPPMTVVEPIETYRVYAISLVKSGEKRKIITVDTTDFISVIKERLGTLFDYDLEDFLLSTGGLIMREDAQIKDYNIEDEDQIVLIPSRKAEK